SARQPARQPVLRPRWTDLGQIDGTPYRCLKSAPSTSPYENGEHLCSPFFIHPRIRHVNIRRPCSSSARRIDIAPCLVDLLPQHASCARRTPLAATRLSIGVARVVEAAIIHLAPIVVLPLLPIVLRENSAERRMLMPRLRQCRSTRSQAR